MKFFTTTSLVFSCLFFSLTSLLTACGDSGVASAAPAAPAADAGAISRGGESTLISAKQGNAKKIPLSVQGQTASGVSIRVKSIEIGEDLTTLDVNMSFSNNMAGSKILMAFGDTFIEDENGQRLFLKRPKDNKKLAIKNGEMLSDQLVFMGHITPNSRKVFLVFNSGMEGSGGIVWPELIIEISLKEA